MAARPIDDIGLAARGDAFGVAPREDAFRTAFRHSRRVRRLRVIVPVVAVALFSGVLFISWWDPLKALNLPVAIGAVSVSGSRVTMEAPRLTGYSNDNRFYRVAASRAEHDIAQSNLVALSAIDAEMELEGGGTARVVSPAGQLDTKTGQIEFNETVSITTSNGQNGRAGHALVDTRAGTIKSNGPVEMSSPRGDLAADRMEMRDNGKVIVLEGNVRGNFMPEPPDPALTGEEPQPPAATPNATSR
ncbi:LPS export ABC transporter periplasmic protein LptC [Phreatobacter aquaticus]|uniref:LPS export ABC transporter periplasmic protein LptC n=1 Tax=Phreatobacter aquaticus TaxID=2570229 RepID=A0A4D7QF28_9HYPH|nr:LPS export ABC transporter periplasmic protein LptC [Phreatobacter aquaticus]QCK85445.1 LPS export ABC transporter periplasmic protein LptC [Phreatobacter aquaticus]